MLHYKKKATCRYDGTTGTIRQGQSEEIRKLKGSSPAKSPGTYRGHFLSVESSPSLGPSNLSWVTLHLKVFVAFGATETENLPQTRRVNSTDEWKLSQIFTKTYFSVVSDKHHSVSRIDGSATEPTLVDAHGSLWITGGSKKEKGSSNRRPQTSRINSFGSTEFRIWTLAQRNPGPSAPYRDFHGWNLQLVAPARYGCGKFGLVNS